MGKSFYDKSIYIDGLTITLCSFYFADERTAEGRAVTTGVSGAAHAEAYLKLAEGKVDQPWHTTFVAGKGFVDFPETRKAYIDS